MIVVEGPDGAGKSTLCKALGKHFDLEVVSPQKNGRMPEVPVRNRVYRALGKAVQGRHPAKIYDRFYWSELVYGGILRGEVAFTFFEQKYVEDVLWVMQVPHILCMPGLLQVKANLAQDPDSTAWLLQKRPTHSLDDVITLLYHQYATESNKMPNKIEYDYTEDSVDQVVRRVHHYLTLRKDREYGT